MRIFIMGMDGYIGWALAQYLKHEGHEVAGIDNGFRRGCVTLVGGQSITPIASLEEREIPRGNCADFSLLREQIANFSPDTVVCLSHQPSAPFSMRGPAESIQTHANNTSTVLAALWAIRFECPEAHFLTIGSMGEYGTPACPIPEGAFMYAGEEMIFPRKPSSLYHSAKVASTYDVEACCRFWGLKATDVMQGVVYGLDHPGRTSWTRFDVDEYFGTAINRFCAQALIGMPLTVYGKGDQKRGFLPLKDSLQCLKLLIENPPNEGEYRCVNQLAQVYSLNELAGVIQKMSKFGVKIQNITNPRVEKEEHYYSPVVQKLPRLGYEPTVSLEDEVEGLLDVLTPMVSRIQEIRGTIKPRTNWRR